MLFDKRTMFSEDQVIDGAAASDSYLDLGAGIVNLGIGGLMMHVQVVEDFATCDSLKVGVEEAADSAFSSPNTLVETGAVPVADLKAGYLFNIPVPAQVGQRFLRLYYTPAGSAPTAGKLTAGLVTDRDAGVHPDLS